MSEKRNSRPKNRILWLTGIAVALAVHAVGLLLFQVDDAEKQPPAADYAFVSVPPFEANEGALLREGAYLFDSAPLFFPTPWNASSSPTVDALEQRPEELFDSFPARLSYGERDFGLGAIVTVKADTILQSLEAFDDRAHLVFGEAEVEQPELSARFALMEVIDPALGETVLKAAVPPEGGPEEGKQLWSPAEFLVQVEATGVVGEPVLLRGSGVEEVDQFLRASLRRLISSRMLDIGYYRVIAGP